MNKKTLKQNRAKSNLSNLGGGEKLKGSKRSGDIDSTSAMRISCPRLEFSATHDPLLLKGLAFWRDCVCQTFDANSINFKNPKDKKSVSRVYQIINSKSFKDFFLDKAVTHLGMFGRACGEFSMNDNQTFLHAVVSVRPHEIDFYRETASAIPLFDDVSGLEVGFVQQSVETGEQASTDVVFRNVDNVFDSENKRTDDPKELVDAAADTKEPLGLMLVLHYLQISRGDWGYGFLEAVYDDTTIKANMEYAKGETSYRMGNPCPIVTYGNENVKIDDKMDQRARAIGKDLADSKTDYAAVPYIYSIDTMANKMGKLSESINKDIIYESQLQACALGIPIEILLQTGVNDPARLIPFMEITLKGIQRQLRIEDAINLILKLEGHKQEITLTWRELTMQSAKEKAMQIFRLSKSKLLEKLKNDPNFLTWVMKNAGMPYVEQNNGNQPPELDEPTPQEGTKAP